MPSCRLLENDGACLLLPPSVVRMTKAVGLLVPFSAPCRCLAFNVCVRGGASGRSVLLHVCCRVLAQGFLVATGCCDHTVGHSPPCKICNAHRSNGTNRLSFEVSRLVVSSVVGAWLVASSDRGWRLS
eukprot:m.107543 g.107543  ORF g.107543 m.107543 type:complete len:128 (+) comp15854_c0_seq1:980-1363(+)